jgi:hypothetical protein
MVVCMVCMSASGVDLVLDDDLDPTLDVDSDVDVDSLVDLAP